MIVRRGRARGRQSAETEWKIPALLLNRFEKGFIVAVAECPGGACSAPGFNRVRAAAAFYLSACPWPDSAER